MVNAPAAPEQPENPENPDTPDTPDVPEVKNGFVTEGGKIYYYVDGVVCKDGLILVDGNYYYARTSSGEIVCGRDYWITYTNGLMAQGSYTFDAEGKMVNAPAAPEQPENPENPDTPDTPDVPEVKNGFVTEGGKIYYYVDGVVCKDGLIQVDGNYYYARTSNGEIVAGRDYWITYTNGLLKEGSYTFDETGKIVL